MPTTAMVRYSRCAGGGRPATSAGGGGWRRGPWPPARDRHCNHESKPEICGQKIHPSHGFSPTARVLQLEAKSKRAMLKPNDTHISILSPPPTPNPTKSLPHRGPNEWSRLTCMVHAAHDGPVLLPSFSFPSGTLEMVQRKAASLSHFYFGLQCKTLLRILY